MTGTEKPIFFKIQDVYWLFAIAVVMATSGFWKLISARPEIGQVAVLWVPSAVLMVALVRNWGRIGFSILAVLVFYAVGVYPSFANGSQVSAISLLSADVLEAFIIAFALVQLGGARFRLNSALMVAFFGATSVIACLISAVIAALVSQVQFGPMPIEPQAPLQVGVAWFTSNLATYFLIGAPLIALTGRDGAETLAALKKTPVASLAGALLVMALTLLGHVLPGWLAAKTGLMLGSVGLILIAFPLAAYLAIRRGATIAALTGAAIGVPSIYATISGFGPFGHGNASANVFDMQASLIVSTFTLLLVGAMAEQLRERSQALEHALDDTMKLRGGVD